MGAGHSLESVGKVERVTGALTGTVVAIVFVQGLTIGGSALSAQPPVQRSKLPSSDLGTYLAILTGNLFAGKV